MQPDPAKEPDDGSINSIDAIIAEYLLAAERSEKPDRAQILAEHPEHAKQLTDYFADMDRLDQALPSPLIADTVLHQSIQVKSGAMIAGRYKLIENIGEGGMGSVWVAEQKEPVKRKVAVKLVKAGMDSKQVLARFEAERQALAMMDHPNIAKVFDGGMTEQGRPFFVMEYVKGIPFTQYCDQARLSLKQRLELFIPVCQAVQHAHHKGIVHRDLKPSNILICLYDGKPVPKVIDFGLAKAMNQQLTEQSIFTGHGVMVGTPVYMSPEQAELNNLDIDTRTDIYSLGVVLYELLTGTTPLEREQLRTAAYAEILRLIKEVEPPRPSTKLSGSASLPSVAAQRNIDPRSLQKSLAGDLDWIVMKSLEKERTRRYDTAMALQRDIDRFLNGEAVEACPPSFTYQLRKFVNKNRGKVTAAIAVVLSLVLGIIGTTWQSIRATRAGRVATLSERKAIQSEQNVSAALEQTKLERDAKNIALAEKTAALSAEAAARDLAEQQMIRGMLRPISFQSSDKMSPEELRCFVDWAAIPDSRLKMRILEVAFENPETAIRVARRADRVLQACVTLSPQRHLQVLKLLSAKQREAITDPRVRVAACWLALELGSTDTPALAESIQWLNDPLRSGTDMRYEFTAFARLISRSIERLSPDQIKTAGNALISLLERSTDHEVIRAATNTNKAIVHRLNSEQQHRFAEVMINRMAATEDGGVNLAAMEATKALIPRMNPDQLSRATDAAVAIVQRAKENRLVANAEILLADLKLQLTAQQLSSLVETLISITVADESDGHQADLSSSLLAKLAPQLSDAQIKQLGDSVLAKLGNHSEYVGSREVTILQLLASQLSNELLFTFCEKLLPYFSKNITFDQSDEQLYWGLDSGSQVLVTLVPRLNDEHISKVADKLIDVLESSEYDSALEAAGNTLSAISDKLKNDQTQRCITALVHILEDSKRVFRYEPMGETNYWQGKCNADALLPAANILSKLAPKLSDEQNHNAGNALISVLGKSTKPGVFEAAANALIELSPRLSAEQNQRFRNALITTLEKTHRHSNFAVSGRLVVLLKSRFNLEETSRIHDAMSGMLSQASYWDDLNTAGAVLEAIAPRIRSEEQLRVAQTLMVKVLQKETSVVHVLVDYIRHVEPDEQKRILTATLLILFDLHGLSDSFYDNSYSEYDLSPFFPAIMAMNDSRSLALLLQHPACVGELRECMLQRFEELVLLDGQRVFLPTPSKSQAESQLASATSEPPPVRRFKTMHDAAEWIQQNWPDFDLEATHPVTFRGER